MCGVLFRPRSDRPDSQFCSRACWRRGARVLPDRACACCGGLFRPANIARRFCSRDCSHEGRSRIYGKCDEATRREIRKLLASPVPQAEIARAYGLSEALLSRVAHSTRWRPVPLCIKQPDKKCLPNCQYGLPGPCRREIT